MAFGPLVLVSARVHNERVHRHADRASVGVQTLR